MTIKLLFFQKEVTKCKRFLDLLSKLNIQVCLLLCDFFTDTTSHQSAYISQLFSEIEVNTCSCRIFDEIDAKPVHQIF